jgi:peptidase M28-like protein
VRVAGIAEDQLEAWITQLALIERPSASKGERGAAEWIATQLQRGGVDAHLEVERAHGTHLPFALPSLIALITGLVRSRRVSAAASGLATVVMADELEGWRRILRRGLAFRRTYNVVGEFGAPRAVRTLIFVSHHDVARPWGGLFGALVSAPPPRLLKGRPLPLVATLVYAPLIVLLGAGTGSRRLRRAGMALCAFIVGLLADISRRKPVPGANDNASGVAALLGLGQDLARRPPRVLRVLLVSTGSEETMLEGMDAFLRRHHGDLEPAQTLVICLDQLGWEHLVLRESEGVIRRYRSRQEDLDTVLSAARAVGVPLDVAPPFLTPSDGLAARWRGIPTVFIGSVAADGGYPHYHRPTDLPGHIHLDSVVGARQICGKLVEELDATSSPAMGDSTSWMRRSSSSARNASS